MINTFQRFMTSDAAKEIIKQIVSIYHPTVNVEKLKIVASLKYDWVMIHAQGISIGLEVYNGFLGTGFTLKQFEDSLSNPDKFEFKSWRFADDKGSPKLTTDTLKEYFAFDKAEKQAVHDLLIKEQVPLPTPKEMYKYYYTD